LATYAAFMIALAAVATTARTIRRAPRIEELRRHTGGEPTDARQSSLP
jgi:hypothetical protein